MAENKTTAPAVDDPFLWLEDIDSDRVREWISDRNRSAVSRLGGDRRDLMYVDALDVMNADTRIPTVQRRGQYLYNIWNDATNPRGVWRRTTLEEYRKDCPAWETVIDLDALATVEDENWAWAGAGVLEPEFVKALVFLTRGGGDAAVMREFDMVAKEFVVDGFTLPEGKHDISWEDADTLLVGTDFGEGSLTESGYPRVIKRWRRGQSIDEADTVFEGSTGDVRVSAQCIHVPGAERTLLARFVDFHNAEQFELRDGQLIRLPIPADCSFAVYRDWAMVLLMSEWERPERTYPAGAVLVMDYEQLLDGTAEAHVVFAPGGIDIFAFGAFSGDRFLSVKLRNVTTIVEVLTLGTWESAPIPGLPDNSTSAVNSIDPLGDEIFVVTQTVEKPPKLLHGPTAGPLKEIKSAPELFDAEGVVTQQHYAVSPDGTSIPYFLVRREETGPTPTLMSGYGAFRVPQIPGYAGLSGRLWLERGGAFVIANIRGGSEFGPNWHEQVVRANRHKVAEDFAAVAQDLVARGCTTPAQLGAIGGSAGGLLTGVMLTQYPQLFGALVSQNPLLDMRRYHRLLAGASWIAEFGDPDDPDEWEFIGKYSPYQNISTQRRYPPILITTATSDDRVHPGHARKMAAALEKAGHDVVFYENTEGGHAGAINNEQAAFVTALTYEFLIQQLFEV